MGEKRWHKWHYISLSGEEELCEFLGRLTAVGVDHKDIKVCTRGSLGFSADVIYYHDTEIEEEE